MLISLYFTQFALSLQREELVVMSKSNNIIVSLMAASILFLACTSKQGKGAADNVFDAANLPAAERLIWEAMYTYNSQRILQLTDSLEDAGDISAITADYYRGAATANRGMLKMAEHHLKKATANSNPDMADLRIYLKSKALLSRVLSSESDYEGALNEALPTLAKMDSLGNTDYGDLTQLHIVVGECQQYLNMPAEAAANFTYAYNMLVKWMATDSTGREMPRIILRLDNIATSYIRTSEYVQAKMWLDREDSALTVYLTKPDTIGKQVDFLRGTISLDLAAICQQLGQTEEARRHYDDYRKTIFSQRNVSLINATDYLMMAGRYAEAAQNYDHLDQVFEKRDLDLSLDNIGTYLLPKMHANILAGRKDSAIAIGMKVIACYDSALTKQKQDATAELATVYDTQGKERQIAEQQMRLSRARVLALAVSIIALTVFFTIFHIIRQRAAKRLAKVNAAKERMESELSIARDIQMSMVPSQFPDYEGLDMYASMTPAKEVGGDLYGYLLMGDKLYFAVGDVSGKGVPASLFMAQATRLFLTLAKQGMMPAEICSRMNDALSGNDNENGMFVTFWLGLVDLTTGHLNFCNAGHNPPVIGGGEQQGEFLSMIPNAPIGIFPGFEYEGEEIDSVKGRPLFIYTDGLNEAENRQQEQFGDDRIIEVLASQSSRKCQDIVASMNAHAERFRNGAEPNDDLTMMCVRLL